MKSKEKNNLTARYTAIQVCYWSGYAAVMGYASVFLLGEGFTNTEIGLLSALGCLLSAVLQPAFATFADHPESPSIRRILMGITLVQIFVAAALFFLRGPKVLIGVCYGGSITLLMLTTPLLNSLGVETMNQGKELNFGAARGLGSAAFAVASFLLGRFTGKFSIKAVPLWIGLMGAGILLCLFWYPFQKTERLLKETKKGKDSPIAFFRRYPRFTAVLVGCIFTFTSHAMINSFTFQIVMAKGGGKEELGIAMFLCAIVELPTMFFFNFLLKIRDSGFWFRVSAVFFFLKSAATVLAPNIYAFYAVQFLQMFGWALVSVAYVYYVNSIMEPQDIIKGQAYMTMTITIGNVAGSLFGGPMIDAAGVNALLAASTISSLIGMGILLFAAREKTHGKAGE